MSTKCQYKPVMWTGVEKSPSSPPPYGLHQQQCHDGQTDHHVQSVHPGHQEIKVEEHLHMADRRTMPLEGQPAEWHQTVFVLVVVLDCLDAEEHGSQHHRCDQQTD